ncbi:MAG: DUF551 domain-containing protein [Oscillospiraceae bacterium]|nr:DUF551 domain-containing protein [Oscillospiraceae bacterium]
MKVTIEEIIRKYDNRNQEKHQIAAWLKELEQLRKQSKASCWTLCSDRMPDKMQLCLVYCREWDLFEDDWCRSYCFRLLEYLPDFKIWNIKTPVQVIAWMPIPELPGILRSRYCINAV